MPGRKNQSSRWNKPVNKRRLSNALSLAVRLQKIQEGKELPIAKKNARSGTQMGQSTESKTIPSPCINKFGPSLHDRSNTPFDIHRATAPNRPAKSHTIRQSCLQIHLAAQSHSYPSLITPPKGGCFQLGSVPASTGTTSTWLTNSTGSSNSSAPFHVTSKLHPHTFTKPTINAHSVHQSTIRLSANCLHTRDPSKLQFGDWILKYRNKTWEVRWDLSRSVIWRNWTQYSQCTREGISSCGQMPVAYLLSSDFWKHKRVCVLQMLVQGRKCSVVLNSVWIICAADGLER